MFSRLAAQQRQAAATLQKWIGGKQGSKSEAACPLGVPRPSRGLQAWMATSCPCSGNSGCSWEFLISKERIRCRICITINLMCQGKLPVLMQAGRQHKLQGHDNALPQGRTMSLLLASPVLYHSRRLSPDAYTNYSHSGRGFFPSDPSQHCRLVWKLH